MQPIPLELLVPLPKPFGQQASDDPLVYIRFYEADGTSWFVIEGEPASLSGWETDEYDFYGCIVRGKDESAWRNFRVSRLKPKHQLRLDEEFTPQRLSVANARYR